MPGARPGPALFELLRDKTGTRPSAPVPPAPTSPAAHNPAPPAPSMPPPSAPVFAAQRISVSTSTLWLALGGLILVLLIIWAIAYSLGHNRGESSALRDFKGSAPITEPLHNDIPVNPKLVSPAPKTSPVSPAAPAVTGSTGPTPGAPSGDPRIAGYNYLTIASRLDKETADRAVSFLSENGVPAFAVAKPGSAANNALYTVYALKGITREMLRARAPERTELEEKVARLGKTWQKEHKGQTDFSKTFWDKFGS